MSFRCQGCGCYMIQDCLTCGASTCCGNCCRAEVVEQDSTDDIDNMSGPELAAAVAREVMGWIPMELGYGWRDQSGHYTPPEMWEPNRDRNDAHRVLKRCEELGLAQPILWTIFRGFDRPGNRPASVSEWNGWKLLTLDPAIICRAALRAVREERK